MTLNADPYLLADVNGGGVADRIRPQASARLGKRETLAWDDLRTRRPARARTTALGDESGDQPAGGSDSS